MTDELQTLRAKFEAWVRVNVTDWHHLSADVKRFAEHVFAGGHASRDAEIEALRTKAAMWDALCEDCDANDAQRNQTAKSTIEDAINMGSGALWHQYDPAMAENSTAKESTHE